MNVSRRVRLRTAWLFVLPFLWFARPTGRLLAVGLGLGVAGAALRAWAAGFIRKDERLAVTGPYAFTRNPLYLGSFLIGLGVTVAGGRLAFVAIFVAFFAWAYGETVRKEAALLEERFGDAYRHYAACVPLFRPRPTPYRAPPDERLSAASFSGERYRKNREYEAALGIAAGFGLLALKMLLA